jgi:DNA repair protein RecO (recombination protein O)
MGYAQTFEAIVLHSYDIGEADKLCVLFTKEKGKILAKAKSVRKLKSKMGGSLLAPNHVLVSVTEGKAGWIVTGTKLIQSFSGYRICASAWQGIESIFLLTEEGESLPLVFDLLTQFLQLKEKSITIFTLRLLHLLGFLPTHTDHEHFGKLTNDERQFVQLCTRCSDMHVLISAYTITKNLERFCDIVLYEQLPRPLKSYNSSPESNAWLTNESAR